MADITWDDVVLVAAELATGVADGFQEMIVDWVNETVVADEFGGDDAITYKLARAYLAAHYAYLHKEVSGGATGRVTSESEGGVSVSYGAPATPPSNGELGLTSYGRAFLSFVKRSPAMAGFLT